MSRDMVYEDVPRLERRGGDSMLANQNNATILLGRDRLTGVETGYGSLTSSTKGRDAGAIHLMAGRRGVDPSFSDDAATAYLSARSDPDKHAGTESIGTNAQGVSSILMRADCVRMVPRNDFKLSVGKAYLLVQSDGTIVVEGAVSLGAGASDRILRGETYVRLVHVPHTHPTPAGVSGPPIQQVPDSIYSPTNRVK